ncbi:sulfatase [Georgenia alba]|uniref:Sulfatase n=1 Tax=Georgenia alba TaxID=2233858 RepID=A0ABW2QAY7_9MICO
MDRPNVLLIVSDDHGYGDFTRFGHDERIRTPNLDRLAASGVSCTDAYVTAPICSPSRAGLISGTYQQRWGARWFDTSRFPDHLPSLAERFEELGYATGYFGKVHYGPEEPGDRACPPHHGFAETFYGLAGMQEGRLNYMRRSRRDMAEYGEEGSWRMAVHPLRDGDTEVEPEGFLTAELGRRTAEFVETHADEPFFAMVAFNAVHNFTFQLPQEELERRGLPAYADWKDGDGKYTDWYDRAIWPNLPNGREYYLAQLELMDAEVGRLLDALEARGLSENTVVVYLTDNGGSTCNFGDNDPLRGGKYTLWEGGIRVPFLVRWPAGGIGGGAEHGAVVSALDLYPSLLSAAGAAPETWSHGDGIDQVGAWRASAAGRHDPAGRTLHWDTGFQWAIRDGDWKLQHVDDHPTVAHLSSYEHAPIAPGRRLTNLAEDPGEQRDLSPDHPEIVRRLAERHAAWQAEVAQH